jgi:hypothetical protein
VNREGGARLKLPNLWRAMDITSGEKARFALRRGERERESEREEVGGWGGGEEEGRDHRASYRLHASGKRCNIVATTFLSASEPTRMTSPCRQLYAPSARGKRVTDTLLRRLFARPRQHTGVSRYP